MLTFTQTNGEVGKIVTIKEIAARAGVSIGTVDRVIHNRGRVLGTTGERVRRILKELNYRPNIFAKNLKLSRTFTFGVLMPKPIQDSMYWAMPIKGMVRAQSELSAQKIQVKHFYYDKYSEASFFRSSRELLAAKLDGLLIAPVLSKVVHSFIRDVPAGVPYVFFDSFIPDADYVSYIGQDAFQSGVLSARLMEMVMKEKGAIAIVRVLPEDYHIDDRVKGFLVHCLKNPGIRTIVYDTDGNKNPVTRQKTFQKILVENPDLKGIFVTNAITHQIARYVKAHAPEKGVHVIGYDLIEENIRYLKEGWIDFLISQQSERQGYEGIYTLYRHVVLKEAVEKNVMMPLDIVTAENIDYYNS